MCFSTSRETHHQGDRSKIRVRGKKKLCNRQAELRPAKAALLDFGPWSGVANSRCPPSPALRCMLACFPGLRPHLSSSNSDLSLSCSSWGLGHVRCCAARWFPWRPCPPSNQGGLTFSVSLGTPRLAHQGVPPISMAACGIVFLFSPRVVTAERARSNTARDHAKVVLPVLLLAPRGSRIMLTCRCTLDKHGQDAIGTGHSRRRGQGTPRYQSPEPDHQ
jgi:hypothetical protein